MQYVTRYTDRLVIGRVLGATPLGYYDYANRFYFYPSEVITAVLLRVMFPTFARLQADPRQLGRAFLRTNGAIAFVTFPMMVGLAVVADPFVRVVLGEPWAPIIPLIRILAPVGMLTALGATPGQLFLALGKSGLRFWWSVAYTTLIASAVLLGVTGGIQGVAVAYATVIVPINVAAFWLALRLVQLRLNALWSELRATFMLSGLMGGAVIALRLVLSALQVPQAMALMLCIAAGAAVYVAGARVVSPRALADLYQLLPAGARRAPIVGWMFARVASAT
jgi:PST family polysaccharide transporter